MAFRRPRIKLLDESPKPDGSAIRCLPDLVEYNAAENPDHLFCVQVLRRQGGFEEDLFRSITFLELEESVRRCCYWIQSQAGGHLSSAIAEDGPLQKSPPIALFLESDIGLFIHIVALLSLNVPCVLLSIRLSPVAIGHLLRQTSATSMLVSAKTRAAAEEAVSALEATHSTKVNLLTAAPFEELFYPGSSPATAVNGYQKPTTKVREDDRDVLILHSSGTTGLPKPIPQTHRYLLGYATCHQFPEEAEFKGRNLSTLPLYHGFGLLAPCLALSIGMPVCLPHPSRIPTGDTTVSLISYLQPSSLMTVPSILEDISLSSRSSDIEALLPLDFVAIGGGPMKPAVAEKLSKHGVKLLNHYGATELGPLAPIFKPEKDYDWHYLRLRTDFGLRLERLSPESELPQRCKLVGYPFGWNASFELADQLECNPLHPDSEVKIIGRKDDLIVLANGEKILSRMLEESLSQNPTIRTAIAFGDGRFEIGVIIEPTIPVQPEEYEDSLEAFWHMVVTANELMDDHARVSSKMAIIITTEEKKIPRSDKGSPMRKELYALYEAEIDSVYENLQNGHSNGLSKILNMDKLEECLQELVRECLGKKLGARPWSVDDDFFDLGMDSLQATRLRRMLIAAIGDIPGQRDHITSDFVYSHPSISQLVVALREPTSSNFILISNRQALMKDYIRQYSFSLLQNPYTAERSSGSVVLLTGSTGNLGAFLLEQLCKNSTVRRIICLGRQHKSEVDLNKSSLRIHQERVNQLRSIFLTKAQWSKIEFFYWDMGEELLGLDSSTYTTLSSEITHIFHGAWPMDFGRKLQSFRPQIHAMRSLIELALVAHRHNPFRRPRIVLASSIAVVGRYPLVAKQAVVPELPMADPSVTVPMGYAEAKWVCEKVMEDAALHFQDEIEPVIIRIGQISGSQRTGFWSQAEHIPALVKASQSLGKLPVLKGTLSWLSVDVAAVALSEMTLGALPRSDNIVYHFENPVRQSWPEVTAIVRRKMNLSESSTSFVPYGDWLAALVEEGSSSQELLEFFKDWFLTMGTGLLVLDTERAQSVSPTLRKAAPVTNEVVESYIESWRKSGFIS